MWVEVYIVLLVDFKIFYSLLYPIDFPEEFTFMIVFCILDDASREINAINSVAFSFETLKLKNEQFFNEFFFELDDFLQRVWTFIFEHTLSHSFAGIVVIPFASIELPWFDVEWLADEPIVVRADLLYKDLVRWRVRYKNDYLVRFLMFFFLKNS